MQKNYTADALNYVTILLTPFESDERSVKANETLEQDEINLLCSMCMDIVMETKNCPSWDTVLDNVADIIKKHGYVKTAQYKANNSSGKIALHPEALPFLIRQVLLLAAVSTKDVENQTEVLKELEKRGVSLSHNFFSRRDMTPVNFVNMKSYEQPKDYLFNYNG